MKRSKLKTDDDVSDNSNIKSPDSRIWDGGWRHFLYKMCNMLIFICYSAKGKVNVSLKSEILLPVIIKSVDIRYL